MSSRRVMALLLVALAVMLVVGACADPRPILKLPAPTPIGRAVEPTPTLVPELAAAVEGATGGGAPAAEELPVPPARPVSADGEAVYSQNCASCHGPDGKGVIPNTPDFTSPDFWRNAVPAQLYLSITNGKGAMPAWGSILDEQQRWNVLFYEMDKEVTPEVLDEGKEIFAARCAACHGEDGKGVVQNTPDFTSPEYMARISMAAQFEVVTNGRGAMPPWGNQLTEDERWAVLTYIRTLAYDSIHQP